jgi:RNA polymerase primary sigma factor
MATETELSDATTYFNEIHNEHVPTREEEVELFQRLEAGDPTAREEIVRANLRFVIKIAYEFVNKGLPLADLIQEGNIGLLEVVSRFDWRRGHRFSTYAAYWIRQAIQIALRKQCSLIRLPVRKSRALGHMSEFIQRFRFEAGREPTSYEIAEAVDLSVEDVDLLLQLREGVLSLDACYDDEDGASLMETVTAPDEESPFDTLVRKQQSATVSRVFDYLGDRERRVLRLRYGFDNGRAMSLRNTSKMIGLSQEGVRRIEHRAIEKLRRPAIRHAVAQMI